MKHDRLSVFCDGLCAPMNPGGLACCAFVVFEGSVSGRAGANRPPALHEHYAFLGRGPQATNNRAEYEAVLRALRWLKLHAPETRADLFSDSKLVVEQANGRWSCNARHLIPLRNDCQRLLGELPHARLTWIRREENDVADALTWLAFREARRKAA